MKQRNMLRISLVVLVCLFSMITMLQAQTDALLINPGFEPPFEPLPNEIEAVAQGWTAWAAGSAQTAEYYAASDTINGVAEPQIRSGSDAQQFFSFFTAHDAGVYQIISDVDEGTNIQFSIFAYVLASDEVVPVTTSPDADMTIQVGIDPTGGTDGTSAAIVWSDPTVTYDAYAQYSIEAVAESDAISVWVRSVVNNALQYNVVYLDDAALFIVDEEIAPTEEATDELTPEVTDEPVVEVTPEITDEPLVEVTPEITDEPVVEVTPEITDEPVVEVTPEVTDEPIVEITLEATVEPTNTATTEPTVEPTLIPTDDEAIIIVTPTFTPSPSPTLNLTLFPLSFTYTVQSGDNLSSIAARFGSTVQGIEIANELAPDAVLAIGLVLDIPVQTLPETPTPMVETPVIIIATVTETPTPILAEPTFTPTAPLFVEQTLTPTPALIAGQTLTAPTGESFVYIVQYGDTLSNIAARFGTTTRELARLNGIVNPNLVFTGQALRIGGTISTSTPHPPTGTPTLIPPTNTPTPIPPTPTQVARVYVVQPGDTLYFISIRFSVSIRALIELNNIVNANRIFVGQVLILP